jgi:hypothetical protein
LARSQLKKRVERCKPEKGGLCVDMVYGVSFGGSLNLYPNVSLPDAVEVAVC